MPSLPDRWCRHYRCLLVIRKVQRAHMAHHHLQDCCYCWFPRRVRASWCCGSLRCYGYLHHRYLRCQLTHSGLVRIYLRSDSREEGCCYWYCHNHHERLLHLDPLPVAQVRCSPLRHRAFLFCCLLHRYLPHRLGRKDCLYAPQQEDARIRQRGPDFLRLLSNYGATNCARTSWLEGMEWMNIG